MAGDALRRVKPLPLPGVTPAAIVDDHVEMRMVAPTDLLIDDSYQRSLSERSVSLIRRIVSEFSWSAFKPPIVAPRGDDLVVIDGQHSAIAAASHGGVDQIPVIIVHAAHTEDQAKAFLAHNRNRVAMTKGQMHRAGIVAGDEIAVAVAEACEKADVRVLVNPPSYGIFKPGDTMAVGTLETLLKRRGVNFSIRLLKILRASEIAPIGAGAIRAVEMLLTDDAWKDEVNPSALSATIAMKKPDEWEAFAEVNVRKGRKIPMWQALAIAWANKTPKRRGASS